MKYLIQVIRILVGLLFIFSGLVKANDPMGLSYKMQEFFEVWGIHGYNDYTLALSVCMNAFEIIAGFALLLGWRIRLIIWLLLLLIIAFTFLTGYTYFTGKPKNCGCFGDCLPITAKTSFIKDVVLVFLIAFLLWKKNHLQPLFKNRVNTIAIFIITLFSIGLQWYALRYLPIVDCLPFKKGNSITDNIKMPTNAIPDSTVITFVYTKEGKDVEFTAENFPADFNKETYTNMRRYDKVVRAGKNNQPAIKGFQLSGETNIDSTQMILEEANVVLIFIENFKKATTGWHKKVATLQKAAIEKNINCYIITAEPAQAKLELAKAGINGIAVFKCDYKAIQTAARVNPTAYLLQKGVVVDKKGGTWISKLLPTISTIPTIPKTNLPVPLQKADSINNP